MKSRTITWAVVVGGTIAATFDIIFALSFAGYRGMAPSHLLQTVASGALGNAAFAGGMATAAFGLALHFALSYLWASLFLFAAWRAPRLLAHPLASGIAFGVIVFLAMRLIVLPLSAFPFPVAFKPLSSTLDLLSHMFLFGVPVAVAASKTSLAKRSLSA